MKKVLKKFFLISATLSLLILAACSGSAINSSTNNSTNSSINPGTEDSSKVSNEPIKLGFILSLSGNFAAMGTPIKEGLELYFEQNPEIAGRKVELIFEDDAGDPQNALRKYEQLAINKKVDIIGGGTVGSIAIALIDRADSDKTIPFINLVGSTDVLAWEKKSDYAWRTSFAAWQYGSVAGKHVAETIGKKAVVIGSDYVAGHEMISDFVPNFEEGGGTVSDMIWAPLGTSDFSSYLTKIENANPEAVFMFIPGADGSRFVKQFQEFGLQEKYTLIDSGALLNAPANIEAVGNAVVGEQAVINYFHQLDSELNKKFVEAYKKKFNSFPVTYSVNGYDGGALIKQIIEKAGSTNGAELISVLNKGVSVDSPRGPVEMDPSTHTFIQNMYVIEGKEVNGEIEFELIKTFENVKMPAENVGYKGY